LKAARPASIAQSCSNSLNNRRVIVAPPLPFLEKAIIAKQKAIPAIKVSPFMSIITLF
jgi:hypothetical protein